MAKCVCFFKKIDEIDKYLGKTSQKKRATNKQYQKYKQDKTIDKAQ